MPEQISKPIFLDETGQRIANSLEKLIEKTGSHKLTIVATADDNVDITNQTIEIYNANTNTIFATVVYNSPTAITLNVPDGFSYLIKPKSTLEKHYCTDRPSGMVTEDTTITITYKSLGSLSTFMDLQGILDSGMGKYVELGTEVSFTHETLDEFKSYYKTQIGKQCTTAIENGVDVETLLGKKHFSYTIEDQSNVKDLIITAIFTDFTLPLPYHADGELCTLYQPTDLIKIYMSLCSNKTYHTTYCNVLNAMINEANDLMSVKNITYGMEITNEKYISIMSDINNSKNALLEYVKKKFKKMDDVDG